MAIGANTAIDQTRTAARTAASTLTILTVLVLGCAPALASKPRLERLLEWNSGVLFGGEFRADKGRFHLRYQGDGVFDDGFEGDFKKPGRKKPGFVVDLNEVKKLPGGEGLLASSETEFSFLAHRRGRVRSRFELGNDFRISFRLKIPNLTRHSEFALVLNRKSKNEFVRVNFLHEIRVKSGTGAARVAKATAEPYSAPAVEWFDQQAARGVKFVVRFKKGKLKVSVVRESDGKENKTVEIVSMSGIEAPRRGKLGIQFSKLTFLMSELEIEGRIPAKWARRQIAQLRAAGKLKTSENSSDKGDLSDAAGDGADTKINGPTKKTSKTKNTKGQKRETRKEGGRPSLNKFQVNIDEPDPEIDDEL